MAIRILVVDDASFIRDMVKKHLRERVPGVEVYEAVDGNRALAALKSQSMDLILSDWEMPNMGGEELLRAVRASPNGADTPFVMVTSRGDRTHVVRAVEAGVSDYLTKPFTPDELLRKVFKHLKGKAAAGSGRSGTTQGIAFASVDVLTGGRKAPEAPTAGPATARPGGKAAVKGRAQLRFSSHEAPVACVVRELSLQSMSALMQRKDPLPTIFDQVVVDLETASGDSLARINGYVFSLQAGENRADTQVIKIVVRFVDKDADKYEVLSKYIAQM